MSFDIAVSASTGFDIIVGGGSPHPLGPVLSVYVDPVWVPGVLKHWNGVSWDLGVLRQWDGVQWTV